MYGESITLCCSHCNYLSQASDFCCYLVLKVLHSGSQPNFWVRSLTFNHTQYIFITYIQPISSVYWETLQKCPAIAPFCFFVNICFFSTTSTSVLPADQTSVFSLPQFCPPQWLTAYLYSVPCTLLILHLSPYVSCFSIHIIFLSSPSTCYYCFRLLNSPSLQGKKLPILCHFSFPRLVLQRVLQREGVTQLSSLHGMKTSSRVAVSFWDSFLFFSFLFSIH